MGGMRVRSRKVPDGVFAVDVSDDRETLTVQAETAWRRPVGFSKHEIGLKFVDVTPETAARLSRLATRNRLRRVLEAA